MWKPTGLAHFKLYGCCGPDGSLSNRGDSTQPNAVQPPLDGAELHSDIKIPRHLSHFDTDSSSSVPARCEREVPTAANPSVVLGHPSSTREHRAAESEQIEKAAPIRDSAHTAIHFRMFGKPPRRLARILVCTCAPSTRRHRDAPDHARLASGRRRHLGGRRQGLRTAGKSSPRIVVAEAQQQHPQHTAAWNCAPAARSGSRRGSAPSSAVAAAAAVAAVRRTSFVRAEI